MIERRVFIVHRTTVQSGKGKRVDKFDLSSAQRFGRLIHILKDAEANQPADNIMSMLTQVLRNFTDEDSILCTGDPLIILVAGMVLERHCEQWTTLRVLKWDKHRKDYTPYYISRATHLGN